MTRETSASRWSSTTRPSISRARSSFSPPSRACRCTSATGPCRSAGYDPGFARPVSWDIDLLGGYPWSAPGSGRTATGARWLVRQLRTTRPDVVVCYGWAAPIARAAIVYCLLTRTPLRHVRGHHVAALGQRTPPPGQVRRLGLLLRRCAGAVSTGTFNREFYIRHGMDPHRIWPGVCPADTEMFGAARAERLPARPGRRRTADRLRGQADRPQGRRRAAPRGGAASARAGLVGHGCRGRAAAARAAGARRRARPRRPGHLPRVRQHHRDAGAARGLRCGGRPVPKGHAGPGHDRGDGRWRGGDRQRRHRRVGTG